MAALRKLLGGDKALRIKGVQGLTIAGLRAAVSGGARLVVYTYCESWVLASFKRTTDPILVQPGASRLGLAAVPILHSLLFGWWGIPWGPFWTVQTVWRSLRGGIDVTDELLAALEIEYADRQLEPLPAA